MRGANLRRHMATAMSVVGVLAVGTAAAALNVRLLHSASSEPARLAMRTTGGITVMNVAPSAASSATASTSAAPTASATATAPVSASAIRVAPTHSPTVSTSTAPTPALALRQSRPLADSVVRSSSKALARPLSPTPASPLPGAATPSTGTPRPVTGFAVQGGDDGQEQAGDGQDGEERHLALPRLTPDQWYVLRIARMAHVRPEIVIAAAKGDGDPALIQMLQQVAQYVGVDLASLANVTSVPNIHDVGHGNPDGRGGTNSDY